MPRGSVAAFERPGRHEEPPYRGIGLNGEIKIRKPVRPCSLYRPATARCVVLNRWGGGGGAETSSETTRVSGRLHIHATLQLTTPAAIPSNPTTAARERVSE